MCDIGMLYCKTSVRFEDISDTASKLQLTQLTLTVSHHQNWQFIMNYFPMHIKCPRNPIFSSILNDIFIFG